MCSLTLELKLFYFCSSEAILNMLIMASFLCKYRYFNPGTFKLLKYKVFFTINMFIAFKYKEIQKLDRSALSLLGYLNQQAVIFLRSVLIWKSFTGRKHNHRVIVLGIDYHVDVRGQLLTAKRKYGGLLCGNSGVKIPWDFFLFFPSTCLSIQLCRDNEEETRIKKPGHESCSLNEPF